jgi:hypothetical protein
MRYEMRYKNPKMTCGSNYTNTKASNTINLNGELSNSNRIQVNICEKKSSFGNDKKEDNTETTINQTTEATIKQ